MQKSEAKTSAHDSRQSNKNNEKETLSGRVSEKPPVSNGKRKLPGYFPSLPRGVPMPVH
jgi:hypothetical protein